MAVLICVCVRQQVYIIFIWYRGNDANICWRGEWTMQIVIFELCIYIICNEGFLPNSWLINCLNACNTWLEHLTFFSIEILYLQFVKFSKFVQLNDNWITKQMFIEICRPLSWIIWVAILQYSNWPFFFLFQIGIPSIRHIIIYE